MSNKISGGIMNLPSEPKVSIIIPNYNREELIAKTLKCLLNVKYNNWECIIVDDGSTDNSVSIIQGFCNTDNRFLLFANKKSGLSAAKNFAIHQSSGKYILPLDSDDLIHPNYIPEAVQIMENSTNTKLVYCKGKYFGSKHGRWKLAPYSFLQLISQNCLPNTSLFRRADFDKTLGYNTLLTINEDWEFWISLLETGGEVYRIPKYYFFYRKHAGSTITNNRDKKEETSMIIYNLHKKTYDNTLEHPMFMSAKLLKIIRKYNKYRVLTFRKPL